MQVTARAVSRSGNLWQYPWSRHAVDGTSNLPVGYRATDPYPVGFLAAITTRLAAAGVSVNAVSAFHHDHLFVPYDRADDTLTLLQNMERAELSPGCVTSSHLMSAQSLTAAGKRTSAEAAEGPLQDIALWV